MVLVQRLVHGAARQQALVHLMPRGPVHQRHVLAEEQVVGVGAVDAADLVDVAEALGHQERRPGTRALEQRVDGDGGTVEEQVRIAKGDTGTVQGVLDPVDELVVGGEGLAEAQLAGCLVEGGEVGEGPADVDGDAQPWEFGRSGFEGHGRYLSLQ